MVEPQKNKNQTVEGEVTTEKSTFRNLLTSLVGRLALVLFIILASGGLYFIITSGGFGKQEELAHEKAKLEAEIEALKDENRLLRHKLERVATDPDYIEDEARKKLGLVREGEIVFRLADEPDVNNNQQSNQDLP